MKMEENRLNAKVRCNNCGHKDVCRYSEAYPNFISDLENRISEMQKTTELNLGSIVSIDVTCSHYLYDKKVRGCDPF
jgi:hypothetical protein